MLDIDIPAALNLGGRAYGPGTITAAAALTMTTDMTLVVPAGYASDNSPLEWNFVVGGALSTTAGMNMIFVDGADENKVIVDPAYELFLNSKVHWVVTGAISLGAGSVAIGDMYSGGAITVGANVICGFVTAVGAIGIGAGAKVPTELRVFTGAYATSDNSGSAPTAPTGDSGVATVGLHNWAFDLESVDANFGEGKANQFAFTYTNGDSLTEATVVSESIWDPTCDNQLNVQGLTASESTIDTATGAKTTSTVTVNFGILGGDDDSAVWSATATDGKINFCYRSEILINGQRMNYVDTIITAAVNMKNSIPTIVGLTVADKDASIKDQLTASVSYPLTAFVCDGDNEQVGATGADVPAVVPGGSLKICITLPATVSGVTLASVYDATLSQSDAGISSQAVIEGNVQNSFTSTSCPNPNLCTVATTVVGAFFTDDTKALSLSGSCLMAIGRRMLEVPLPSVHGARNMVEADGRGEFDIAVPLAAAAESTSSASDSTSVLFAAATLFALVLV